VRGPHTSYESRQILQRTFLRLFHARACSREEAITRTAIAFRVDRRKVAMLVDHMKVPRR
jgi:hypothetical protein